MRIDKTRFEELKDSTSRGSVAIYNAIKAGVPATFEDLLPYVTTAYELGDKHRSPAYIRGEVRNTIKWLTY